MALILLVLSGVVCLFYYGPGLNHLFPFAVGAEFWPYLLTIPVLGLGLRVVHPKLRRQWARLGLATVFLVLSAMPVLHWWGGPSFNAPPPGLRVMSYNVWFNNTDYAAIQASITQENPDILFLTELSQTAMKALKAELNYPYQAYSSLGKHGLLSQYPILSATTDYTHVTDHGRNFILNTRIQIKDEIVAILGFHPPIPLQRSSFMVRNQQYERLAPYLRQLQERIILLGDFNTSPWSFYFRRFEKESQLTSATRGHGIISTWYHSSSWPKVLAKIPIDHILTRGFDPLAAWTGAANGSDHRPVIVVLKYP